MKYINTLKKYNKMIVKENQRLYKIYSSLLAESEEIEELEDETIVDSKEVCKEDTTSREDKITDEFLTRVFGESEECEDATDCKKVEESEEVEDEVELETESEKVCEKEDGDWISAKEFFKMEESEEIDVEDFEEIDEEEDVEISVEDEVSEDIDDTIEEFSDSGNVTITIADWVSDDEDTPEPDEEFFRNLEKKYGVKIDIVSLNGVNNMPEVNITGKEVDLKKIIADEYLATDDQEVIDDFYQDSIVSEIQEEAVDANEFFNV